MNNSFDDSASSTLWSSGRNGSISNWNNSTTPWPTPSRDLTLSFCVCMLVLCLLGIYGNVISILIFTRPVMRSSINIFLTGLSAIDLCILILSVPVFFVPGIHDYAKVPYWDKLYVYVLCWIYPVIMVAQTSSVWTFVMISIERFLAVCRPFRAHSIMSASRAKRYQCLVVLAAFVYNLVRFWEYRPSDWSPWYAKHLRADSLYISVYVTGLYIATHYVCPFTMIVVLNVRIVRAIERAHKQRQRLNAHQTQEYRTAQMIIVVTIMFACCNTLALVVNVWEASDTMLFEYYAFTAFLLVDINNILIIFNSATTFLIYLVYCRRYRSLFKKFNRRLCTTIKRGTFERPVRTSSFLTNDWTDEDLSKDLSDTTAASLYLMRTTTALTPSAREVAPVVVHSVETLVDNRTLNGSNIKRCVSR